MESRVQRRLPPVEFSTALEDSAATADFIRRRRECSRRKHAQDWKVFTLNAVAMALAAGILLGIAAACTFIVRMRAAELASPTAAAGTVNQAETLPAVPDYGMTDGAGAAAVPRAAAADTGGKILEDVPLPADTQWAIYEAAGRNPLLFGALIAIADRESGFDPEATGDGGRSRGMFQINTAANRSRLAYYGYVPDDMEDPVRGATIAADILKDLITNYGFGGLDGNAVYMAYNMGPGAAARAIRKGINSTGYSRAVLDDALVYATAAAGAES